MQTKTHMRVAKFAAIAIALTLLFSSLLLAQQTITATLSGAVSDSSGAVLSGAKITLTAPERGFSRIFTTNNTGEYVFLYFLRARTLCRSRQMVLRSIARMELFWRPVKALGSRLRLPLGQWRRRSPLPRKPLCSTSTMPISLPTSRRVKSLNCL